MSVKKNPLLFFSKSTEWDYSTTLHSPRIGEWVPGFYPCLNTASETLDVLESHGDMLRCLTGSRPFMRSASVEDDLLVFRQ